MIRPGDCGDEIRGGGNATRQMVDLMPPACPADRQLICEVYIQSDHWSSCPSHKHDPAFRRTRSISRRYYFRYKDTDGYRFHRVYISRRDEAVRVTHGDVVAVRDGYHPFVTADGYDACYLKVLAGTRRSIAASDDPRYANFRRTWPPPDSRLPLVAPPVR